MAKTKDEQTSEEVAADSAPVIAVNAQEPDVSDPQEPTGEETPTMAELNGVRYKGLADRRIIRHQDLIAIGVESPKDSNDLIWEAANDFVVSSSQINAQTRDALLSLEDFVAV